MKQDTADLIGCVAISGLWFLAGIAVGRYKLSEPQPCPCSACQIVANKHIAVVTGCTNLSEALSIRRENSILIIPEGLHVVVEYYGQSEPEDGR